MSVTPSLQSTNGAQSANRKPTGPEESRPYVPQGVADYFWAEAYARRQLEHELLELYRSWGYQDVIPPLFEYADTYAQGSGTQLRAETYRFFDRDGSTVALRPDMTIPVARLVGVRLHDRPMPQRYCYAGSVFRYVSPQAGRQREFTQTGIELIGANGAAADAEVIALAIESMRTAAIPDFRLVIGQIGYFDGLLHDLNLTPEQTASLLHAVDRNSQADLVDFLRTTPLRTQQRDTIEGLPYLAGQDAGAILDHAERLSLNFAMHKALANLRAIVHSLDAYGLMDYVYLDISEINNLGYYTGCSFELLVPGMGFAVGSGGRYDNLVGKFGPDQPAVGVALGIDRMLLAHRLSNPSAKSNQPVAPHFVIACGDDPICLQLVQTWRARGLRIVLAVDDLRGEALQHAAQHHQAQYALEWNGQSFNVYDSQALAQPTPIPLADIQSIVDLVKPHASTLE